MHVHTLFDMSGKVALVTGGSRGLGLEMAIGCGEAGAAVAITARRESWLRTAEEEIRARGITCLALTCDVSRPEEVHATVAAVLERLGRIDALVNNAGVSWGAPAETMPVEKWNDVLATNATGCFLMSQAVGREMIRAGGGSIINIASVSGLIGTAPEVLDAVGYAASKGAVISLTRDLAVKWARHGVRVNAVAPGFFETRLSAGRGEEGRSHDRAADAAGPNRPSRRVERGRALPRIGGVELHHGPGARRGRRHDGIMSVPAQMT